MSRTRGKLSKNIRGASDAREKYMMATFGDVWARNPDACRFVYDSLLAVDDMNALLHHEEHDNLTDAELDGRCAGVSRFGEEILLKIRSSIGGNAGFFRDFADALEQFQNCADPARAIIIGMPDAMARSGVQAPITVDLCEQVMRQAGVAFGGRSQLRRMLNECGVPWAKGKAGRPRRK